MTEAAKKPFKPFGWVGNPTPGPWFIQPPEKDAQAYDVYGQGERGPVLVWRAPWGGKADACVISAAPEMRDLLAKFAACRDSLELHGLKKEAAALLDKAGGR